MYVVIFGRPGCPYCARAHELAEKMAGKIEHFRFRYVNIEEESITKEDLTTAVGKKVNTVPQIFIDQKPIGGYTEFEQYVRTHYEGIV